MSVETRESRPAGNGTAINKINGGQPVDRSIVAESSRRHVAALLERIDVAEASRRRAVREAVRDALACQWTRRAEVFEWARPRPGDYRGNADPADLAAADKRCADAATACRTAAALRTVPFDWDRMSDEVWGAVA